MNSDERPRRPDPARFSATSTPVYKLAICGCPDIEPDPGWLDHLVSSFKRDARWIGSVALLVGDAEGVDAVVTLWGRAKGLSVTIFAAEWELYGKSAGPRRNQAMIAQADGLIAIWDGQSRGTADTIRRAKRRGLPVSTLRLCEQDAEKARAKALATQRARGRIS